MARLLPFLLMDKLDAARFRSITANDEHRLEPIEIRGGPHKGKYAMNASVRTNENYRDRWDAFAMLDEIPLDVDEAFPPIEEEEE